MGNVLDIKGVMEKSAETLTYNTMVTIDNHGELYAEMVHYLEMLNMWTSKLQGFEQNAVLKEVCYDLLSSLYIAGQGMYRNAYICLRSALELGVSFTYFIDRNYDYLLWKVNDYDMKWSTLKDPDNGLLSKKYFSLFLGDIEVSELIEKFKTVYRECSEYVHGKYKYMHTIGEQKILYQKEKIETWASMFIDIVKLLNILYTIRFTEYANSFADDKKISLKEILSDYKLGGIL
ncbi:hypothetical protein CN373_10825 [Bacillus cereus]|uniref:hypothetical protein n=1 Tax=Bacillus cereus TaxID=1396 RepID=UPI000BF45EA0|nr:hypothetical protein [Bacillus cereus]PFA22246.1 hypothetical protein CN373_10825 [Bacillus cereus]